MTHILIALFLQSDEFVLCHHIYFNCPVFFSIITVYQNILYDYCITFPFFLKIMENKRDTYLVSALSLVQYCITEYYNKSQDIWTDKFTVQSTA